ncbi:hypothetical protein [Micromonospora sp. NPDC005806]|uniref:hypothetical protein n=1 Tax=Micromonospora sp. NPDC005806 TaxID=3364234 RepID=UPI00368A733E
MKAVVAEEFGGPDVLREVEVKQPEPEPHQVLVKVTVSGVDFLDVPQQTGATRLRTPFRVDVEGSGLSRLADRAGCNRPGVARAASTSGTVSG